MGEQEQAQSGEVSKPAEPESSVCTKTEMCIIAGDYPLLHSLLKHLPASPTCCHRSSIGWGLGGCGETARICPDSKHCLFPLTYMGSHVTVRGDHKYINSGYMELGARVMFSLILSVKEKSSGRKRHLQQVNTWLHSLCHKQGFVS